jgi:metal-sulfur cluster biosynthetic enzyme
MFSKIGEANMARDTQAVRGPATVPLDADMRAVLNTIGDPCSVASGTPMGIEELGLIGGLERDADGHVAVAMRMTAPLCHNAGYFKVEVTNRLLELEGVTSVDVTIDNGMDWTPADISPAAQLRRRATLAKHGIQLPVVSP